MDKSPKNLMKTSSQDSFCAIGVQILRTKIPKHRRPKFKIETREALYKKIDSRKDQSQRVRLIPFDYYRKTTIKEEVDHVRQTLRASSKMLRNCKFQLWRNRDMNSKIFAEFSQELKKAQGLKILDFDLDATSKINDLALKNMSVGLKPLKHLQYLQIRIVMCPNVTNRGFADIGKALKRLSCLETLELRFNDGGSGTEKGLGVLWKSLKYLTGLKTLSMGFSCEAKIPFEKMADAEKEFKWFKSLKTIKLNFEAMWMTIHSDRAQYLSKLLKVLTGLEEIHLLFVSCQMDDESLEELMGGFEGKSKLKKITLKISGDSLTNKGLTCLKECFKRLNEIEEISIILNESEEITTEGVENLKKSFKEMPSLKHFTVQFLPAA